MHASAPQRLVHGRFHRLVLRPLCRLAGIDPRRCLCMRCIAARSGLFRRSRVCTGGVAYADVHVLGVRIRHRVAFDLPQDGVSRIQRRAQGRNTALPGQGKGQRRQLVPCMPGRGSPSAALDAPPPRGDTAAARRLAPSQLPGSCDGRWRDGLA